MSLICFHKIGWSNLFSSDFLLCILQACDCADEQVIDFLLSATFLICFFFLGWSIYWFGCWLACANCRTKFLLLGNLPIGKSLTSAETRLYLSYYGRRPPCFFFSSVNEILSSSPEHEEVESKGFVKDWRFPLRKGLNWLRAMLE